jgi:hypothetical protein
MYHNLSEKGRHTIIRYFVDNTAIITASPGVLSPSWPSLSKTARMVVTFTVQMVGKRPRNQIGQVLHMILDGSNKHIAKHLES